LNFKKTELSFLFRGCFEFYEPYYFISYFFTIPNTNNGLEGQFTDLKSKLRNHNGLSKKQRQLFIDEYFKHKNIAYFEH